MDNHRSEHVTTSPYHCLLTLLKKDTNSESKETEEEVTMYSK